MRYGQRLFLTVLLSACGICSGCGQSEFPLVSVSGVVTLDGKPLSNARVGFQPQAKEGIVAGPGSYGRSDENGRYELTDVSGRRGAVAGKHTIWISTYDGEEDPATGKLTTIVKELVPERYFDRDQLEFMVPEEGTSTANLDLTTKK